MSFDKLAEDRIRAALDAGEFDDLPGKGKPLNLDEYFSVSEERRPGSALQKSAGFLPQEMQLLKDVAELKALLSQTKDPERQQEIEREIREKNTQYELLMERRRVRSDGRFLG